MRNPFKYGEIVKGEYFCNRTKELKEIKTAIYNRYSFWLYSPRRYGKTSLILESFNKIKNVKTIYFDLYNIQSLDDFAKKYAQILAESLFNWKDNISTLTKKFGVYFKNLLPKASFDQFGNPSFSLEVQSIEEQQDIETILQIPAQIAKKNKQQICIAFDEFQEINRIEPFLINWMRSSFQRQKDVSYIFLGSKQSLMESIFASTNSPLYEFGFKMPIYPISSEDLTRFIKEKFAKSRLSITDTNVGIILNKSDLHPHFTQYFASIVWQLIYEGIDQDSPGFTDLWINRIIASQSIIFQNIYDQLNKNQRNVLRSIALLKTGEELFSQKVSNKFNLPVSSTLATTLKGLIKKDLIHHAGKTYTISNPVFKEWIVEINK
ncbi:MAG: ATP-binding protein [Cytophagales bacterium]|nr:ATP-binding protein [Cytophagales bacterium]